MFSSFEEEISTKSHPFLYPYCADVPIRPFLAHSKTTGRLLCTSVLDVQIATSKQPQWTSQVTGYYEAGNLEVGDPVYA